MKSLQDLATEYFVGKKLMSSKFDENLDPQYLGQKIISVDIELCESGEDPKMYLDLENGETYQAYANEALEVE